MSGTPSAPVPGSTSLVGSYEEELAQTQSSALSLGFRLAAPLLVAFTLLDVLVVSDHWRLLGAMRLVCAALLLVLGRLLAERRAPVLPAGLLGLAAVAVPISAGVLWSGGTASPYLDAMLIPMSAVAILVPLRPGQLAAFLAEVMAVALVPLCLWQGRGAWAALAPPVSYYLCVSILAVSGAALHDRLRRREHAARREMVRQVGLVTLGQMSGSLAHELANPLSVVSMQLELHLRRLQHTGEPTRGLETALQAAQRMRDTLQVMRRGARLGDGERKPVDLVQECELALTLVGPRAKGAVEFVRDLAPLPRLTVQPTLLGQVLVNLLANACHALAGKAGGQVTLRSRVEGGQVLLEVEDNGPGVPPSLREQIFEPFFTTKGEEGNGLGLWICSEIAQAHGGRLSVHDAPGGGALFRLALPLPKDAQLPTSVRSA